jgi:hypothetical protein
MQCFQWIKHLELANIIAVGQYQHRNILDWMIQGMEPEGGDISELLVSPRGEGVALDRAAVTHRRRRLGSRRRRHGWPWRSKKTLVVKDGTRGQRRWCSALGGAQGRRRRHGQPWEGASGGRATSDWLTVAHQRWCSGSKKVAWENLAACWRLNQIVRVRV